jgi:hypothetical protein
VIAAVLLTAEVELELLLEELEDPVALPEDADALAEPVVLDDPPPPPHPASRMSAAMRQIGRIMGCWDPAR